VAKGASVAEVVSSLAIFVGGIDGAAPSGVESISFRDLLDCVPWPSFAVDRDEGKVEVPE